MDTTPRTFDSLTGLRFVLALWIAVFHLGHMYDHAGWGSHPMMRAGVARVDLFFVLSGFVLTHVYWARTGGDFNFGRFLQARFARLFPLHLLALLMFATMILGAQLIGRSGEVEGYTLTGFLANLFLLQAWGIPGAGAWNFPAWTISAEFTGYLLFPLFLSLATCFRSRPLVFLAGALGFVVATDLVFRIVLGRSLTESTAELGAVRGAVVILTGVAARVAFEALRLSARTGAVLAVTGALIALAGAMLSISTAVVAAGGVLLILGLAVRDAAGAMSPFDGPVMQRLGHWSYGVFILHVPVYMAIYNVAAIVGHDLVINWVTTTVMVAILIAVSAFAHHMIEEPARRWIRGWGRTPRLQAA